MMNNKVKVIVGYVLCMLLIVSSAWLIILAGICAFCAVWNLYSYMLYRTIGFIILAVAQAMFVGWLETKVEKLDRKIRKEK